MCWQSCCRKVLTYSTMCHKPVPRVLPVTAAIAVRSRDASRSFARTSSRSVVVRRFGGFLYSPSAVGFRLVRWSIAGCDFNDVKRSCLFEPHVMGANFCYRTFPCGCGIVAFRFFSVSLKVLPQGNLRRRSLLGPRSATTGWLTNTALSSGFFLFIYLWQFTFGLQVGIL